MLTSADFDSMAPGRPLTRAAVQSLFFGHLLRRKLAEGGGSLAVLDRCQVMSINATAGLQTAATNKPLPDYLLFPLMKGWLASLLLVSTRGRLLLHIDPQRGAVVESQHNAACLLGWRQTAEDGSRLTLEDSVQPVRSFLQRSGCDSAADWPLRHAKASPPSPHSHVSAHTAPATIRSHVSAHTPMSQPTQPAHPCLSPHCHVPATNSAHCYLPTPRRPLLSCSRRFRC